MINAYLQDVCTLRQYTTDKFKENTTETDTDYKCRFEFSDIWITIKGGEQVKSTAQVYFKKTVPVDHTDRIIYESNEYIILKIMKPKSFNAIQYMMVFLQ